MPKHKPDRFKLPHNRDLTRQLQSCQDSKFIDYDRRARQQCLDAGYFLDGEGGAVRAGNHPLASLDIAIYDVGDKVGIGTVLRSQVINDERQGCQPVSQRNRIPLRALIAALSVLKTPHAVTVTCASEYLNSNMMMGRPHRWHYNGWKTAKGTPVKSQDLWVQILALGSVHKLRFLWPTTPRSASMTHAEELALRSAVQASASRQISVTS